MSERIKVDDVVFRSAIATKTSWLTCIVIKMAVKSKQSLSRPENRENISQQVVYSLSNSSCESSKDSVIDITLGASGFLTLSSLPYYTPVMSLIFWPRSLAVSPLVAGLRLAPTSHEACRGRTSGTQGMVDIAYITFNQLSSTTTRSEVPCTV